MKKILHSTILLAAAALLMVNTAVTRARAESATQALTKESVIETIKKNGVMRVGLTQFTPWAMTDKNGELIGFEIDVAKKLAKDMGVDVEFVPTAWDGIIPALIAGKFDAIISGMTVTTKRNLTVNFSTPYASSGVMLYANKKRAASLTTMEDFNSPNVTIAALRGSTAETAAKLHFPKAKLVLLDDQSAAFQEVVNGDVEAGLSSEIEAEAQARTYPDTVMVPFETALDPSPEAIALRKGDVDALNLFDNWITLNTENGWLKARYDYWFHTDKWADLVPSK